jgi:hypothetical protein
MVNANLPTEGHEKKKAATVRGLLLNFILNCVLNSGSQMLDLLAIVLVFVDFLAGLVLLLVELLLLALGQVTIVGSHISLLLVIDVLFLFFNVRGLSRRHGAVLDAIRDAVLLILLAGIDFVDARMIRINYSRSRAGCVAVLGLSSGGANQHKTTHCQD